MSKPGRYRNKNVYDYSSEMTAVPVPPPCVKEVSVPSGTKKKEAPIAAN